MPPNCLLSLIPTSCVPLGQRQLCDFCDQVVLLPNNATMKTFLKTSSVKLGFSARRLFTENGAEIDDIGLLRDDDIIFVSRGEQFAGNGDGKLDNFFLISCFFPGQWDCSAQG